MSHNSLCKSSSGHKKKFSKEEDIIIMELVKKYNYQWRLIALEMGTRNARQIRERYLNYFDPKITKGNWTEEEDQQLMFLSLWIRKPSWKTLVQLFPGRTDVQLRNRFISLNSRSKKDNFSVVEINYPHDGTDDIASEFQTKKIIPDIENADGKEFDLYVDHKNLIYSLEINENEQNKEDLDKKSGKIRISQNK